MISFKRHRFPKDIIITAVRWYLRYKLSFSDVSELLLERGINVSREAIREWVQKFGPQIGNILDKKRRKIGKQWHVDETYFKVAGVWKYVYRAVDEDIEVIDIYVSDNRDKSTAKRSTSFYQKIRDGKRKIEVVWFNTSTVFQKFCTENWYF